MEKRKWDYLRDGHWMACQTGTRPVCSPDSDEQDSSCMIALLVLAIILLAIVVVVASI